MQTDPLGERRSDRPIAIYLTHDEGLVLFDLLARGDEAADRTYRVEHSAEHVVLWGLRGILDSWLVAPFAPDYADRLDAARRALAVDPVE